MNGAISARRRRLLGLLGGTLLGVPAAFAANAARLDATTLAREGQAWLRFALGGAVEPALAGVRVFGLENPERLVIDLPATVAGAALEARRFRDGVVAGLRYGAQADGSLRVVVDLRRPVRPRWRVERRAGGAAVTVDLGVPLALPRRAASAAVRAAPLRDVVVAIDPGHGGRDPGAIGPRETFEKDVVLDVGRRLYRQLAAVRGVTPAMTREDDVYVDLGERLGLARERRADLFVSIHADAFPRREAHGSSVYALSLDGASSEAAAWLAKSENESAALYGGSIALEGLGAGLRETLLDLAQSSTLEASLDVGAVLLAELGQVGAVHKPRVEQANFAVLRSPDIPSVLVETAFISNPEEERKLGDPAYRERLATALRAGLERYLATAAPAGTLLHAARG